MFLRATTYKVGKCHYVVMREQAHRDKPMLHFYALFTTYVGLSLRSYTQTSGS